MTILTYVKETFDELSDNGYIGSPTGELAYAYLRVSTSSQSDEGRSGLPRQLKHIREAAIRNNLQIPFHLVFADEHSGFEFEARPEFSKFRKEYRREDRRAHAVVIENLDRLSRNADWHQGFLLDEMNKHGIRVIFWKPFSSRIERAVVGAIAQHGMEQEKQRMIEGTYFKARSGRITAKTPAYGYMFVDHTGNPNGDTARDTYYALKTNEAEVMAIIFEKIGTYKWSLKQVAEFLEGRYPPPGKYTHWDIQQIRIFVKNPVYKGEFSARRFEHVKIRKEGKRPGESGRVVTRKIERPRNEWIIVPVPPIVSEELWEKANSKLSKANSKSSAGAPLLLSGLIRCASCGKAYISQWHTHRRADKKYIYSFYRCSTKMHASSHPDRNECMQGLVASHRVDDAVWQFICKILLSPRDLAEYLSAWPESNLECETQTQIAYLSDLIAKTSQDDDRLYKAYMANVFDEDEYATRRKLIRLEQERLGGERARLEQRLQDQKDLIQRRKEILRIAAESIDPNTSLDAPFEVKHQVIRLIADRIILNTKEKWCRIEGALTETIPLSPPKRRESKKRD